MLDGYRPAAEYAEWLRTGLMKPLAHLPNEKPEVPTAVGATETEAGILVWFVDGPRTMKRWADPKAFDHPQLLKILRASGSSPRVEHLAFSDFLLRWDRAAAARRLPDLIASEKRTASVRDLERHGRLLPVVSQRLTGCRSLRRAPTSPVGRSTSSTTGRTSPPRGGPWVKSSSRDRRRTYPDRNCRTRLIRSGLRRLPAALSPATWRASPQDLKEVASEASPQLTRCTKAAAWQRGLEVETGSVEIRGGKDSRGRRSKWPIGARRFWEQTHPWWSSAGSHRDGGHSRSAMTSKR